ncbi:T9SS type A sorting domain-containing protein [Rufibacter sp. XAAS-G3-1]|uniref:T9SS type A sorting domain-containing protein n=1 Tax=Rufibacter sp. XAAS-G3-1 TaxID=2729134 RepID=UPI0015E79CE0|nr:T9SS type A sorting domain-containing protein [Rufibacter sp. XAAS-G3-1]
MFSTLRFLAFALFLFPLTMYGEGSKQLTPNRSGAALTSSLNDKAGYLAHDANLPSATGVAITSLSFLKPAGFSRNGATYSKDHRLYIRVKAGERLFYGVRRAVHDQTTANQANLVITLRRTNVATGVDDAAYAQANTLTANTSSTRDMLLVAGQNGVINSPTEAQNGPNRSVNGKNVSNGYKPLSIHNTTDVDYDYYVEFTQVGETSWTDDGRRFSVYDLWDFTVIDANGDERQGRLRSKLWSFSAGGTANVFSKDFNMFPLIPSQDQTGKYFVKKIELAGIAPQNFFRFVTNSAGSASASNRVTESERRKSQLSQTDYPEYFNFVNDPDPAIWPSATAPSFTVSMNTFCNTTTGGGRTLFNLNTTERSTFLVLINLNGTDGYQANTSDVLLESVGNKGTRAAEWNGLDGLGKVVPKGTALKYFFRNGSAPVHFPVWDAEWNDGFRVLDVRPLAPGTTTPDYSLLYWDDINLAATSFPTRSELFGIESTAGVHTWGSASRTAGDLKTVNTWTYGYTSSSQQDATLTYDCSADVAVTNTAPAGSYAVGREFTYTVTVTNNGPMPATNVVVTDKLDAAKLQFISSSDASYTNSSTGSWNVGTLAVGASKTLTITAKPLVTGNITTTAAQSHTEADNVPANNSMSTTITVQPSADIAVSNTVSKTSLYNGELVTYTITALNLGPDAANGVTVTDKLPAGLTLSTTPSGYNAATGLWTVGTLAVNETKTLTLTARASQLGNITTTATSGSRANNELDLNDNNNTASNTITVTPAADVAVTGSVSNSAPGQGDAITYTIKVNNLGPNNATNVAVANPLPAGLTYLSHTASAGTFRSESGTWTVGTVVTGGTQTLTITAKPTVTGTVVLSSTQTHTETDTQSNNNTAGSTITVKPTADVAVTNVITSASKATYDNGEEITYTVTVTNNGPSTATNVVITNKLPASLNFVSASNSTGTGTYSADTGTWPVGTLAKGASATLTLVAKVTQSAIITTTATQTHAQYDNVNGNNSASTSITSGTGIISADVKVSITESDGPYYTGKEVTLIVKAENQGPDAATNVTLEALVPVGFTLKSATPKVGSYNSTSGVWTVGSIASNAYTELLVVAVPNPDHAVAGDKSYTFTATKKSANETDPNTANNTASTTLTVQKAADPSVTLAVSGDVNGVYYNGVTEATFIMTVTNNGPDKITNLVGYDTRSETLEFTYAEEGKGYDPVTGKWVIPSLDPGQFVTLLVKGKPNKTGRLNLGGSITYSDQHDLNSENNKAVALLNVVPVAELQITNTAADGPYYNGQNTFITVKVRNNGADPATQVQILNKLPAGLTFVSADPTVGTYDATTGIWTLGTEVLPGTTQSLVLEVKPTAGVTYATTASVKTATEFDNDTANNSATTAITVGKTADIALSSSIVPGPYYVGGKYQVTITATNLGPDPATGVVSSASVASGLRIVPDSEVATEGTTVNTASSIWTIGNIGVNETKTLTFLAEPLTTGTLNSLGYKSAQNEFDPNGGTTQNGNNSTVVSFTIQDRKATAQVVLTGKHMFFYKTGDHIIEITDLDGPIENARLASGTLPAGMRLESDGTLEVNNKFALVPGTYTLTIETTDTQGGVSSNTLTYAISGDWDNDGVPDVIDRDDNNDGIITEPGAVNPTGDHDGDGIYNFLDKDFVHPVYGAFQDKNNDDIHDAFDLDLDGLIRGFDIDIDGDGITNTLEANGGKAPAGYDPVTGTFPGQVNEVGIPLAVLDANGKNTLPNPDTDGDGFVDFQDIDSDNDGILDTYEAQLTQNFNNGFGIDLDSDGLSDGYDATTGGQALIPVDTDKDGTPDYLDRDSDGDFSLDYVEAFDDNADGKSLDDLMERARVFEEVNAKNYYVNDQLGTEVPNWLKLTNAYPVFLTKTSSYYHDSDLDGMVDLFDTDSGGRKASLQTSDNNEYSYRSSEVVTPLPVTLISFTAKAQKGGVELKWGTASEKENEYFQVERSLDGKNFSAIGQVKGAGNSTVRLDYRFLDSNTATGTVYYRLKQVDANGAFEYSKTVALETKASAASITVKAYPNPTPDVVNLDLTQLPVSDVQISIYALNGRLLKTLTVTGGSLQKLDLTTVAVGTYLVKLKEANVVTVLRVVKQ